jgi:ATP-dependent DNA ligase
MLYVRAASRGDVQALQEFVIGGFTDPQRGRSGFGALLVGLYDSEGKFIYAGKVGTGFDEATLRELRGRLDSIKRGRSAFDTPNE